MNRREHEQFKLVWGFLKITAAHSWSPVDEFSNLISNSSNDLDKYLGYLKIKLQQYTVTVEDKY